MFTIYKYPIPIVDNFFIEMPTGAQVLSCHMQHDEPQLWALVDKDAPTTTHRLFTLIGTGNPINEKERSLLQFVGTILMKNDQFVLHLFEIIKSN